MYRGSARARNHDEPVCSQSVAARGCRPSGTPQSITQTQDGYIWVSTNNGLFRFDGVRFVKWNPRRGDSLPSSSLWYLFGSRNGSLYVGTDRGLVRITAGHVYNYPDSPRWPGPFVEDPGGVVWMGVSGAHSAPSPLCKVGERKLECLGNLEGVPCGRGLSNTIAADGCIWIGSTGMRRKAKPMVGKQLFSVRRHHLYIYRGRDRVKGQVIAVNYLKLISVCGPKPSIGCLTGLPLKRFGLAPSRGPKNLPAMRA